MIRLLCLMLICATPAHAALEGLPAPVIPESFARIDGQSGLVRIRCRLGRVMRYFRGALIEPGHGSVAGDVVLTALHGLPEDTEVVRDSCYVIGPDGTRTGIERIWRPPLRGRVSSSDWAVLLTAERLGAPAQRLRILGDRSPGVGDLAAARTAVRLPLLTTAAEHACSLTEPVRPRSALHPKLFAHTCRAWPGHSGAPILIDADGQSFVLGIHLGRRRDLLESTVIGIGRTIDAAVLSAIDAAVEAGSADEPALPDSAGARQRGLRSRSGTILR